eukprot:scaffold2.g6849.t1
MLHNEGKSDVYVEHSFCSDWELVEVVVPGKALPIAPGYRFFAGGRPDAAFHLLTDEASEAAPPQPKRWRRECEPPDSPAPDLPVLFHRSLAPHNQGAQKLRDLVVANEVSGPIWIAVIFTFGLNLGWLLQARERGAGVHECPALRDAGKLILVHSQATACGDWDHAGPEAPPEFLNDLMEGDEFPRKDALDPLTPPTSEFAEYLRDYIKALRMRPQETGVVLRAIDSCDFSCTRAALAGSVPGTPATAAHTGPDIQNWGHPRLRALLEVEPFPSEYRTAARDSVLVMQYTTSGLDKGKGQYRNWVCQVAESMRAGSTVRGEPLGPPAGGEADVVLVPPLPSAAVAQWVHQGMTDGAAVGRADDFPHCKTYSRVTADGQAALGELQKEGSKLVIKSYELGVLLLPSYEANYQMHRQAAPARPSRRLCCANAGPWQARPCQWWRANRKGAPAPPHAAPCRWHGFSCTSTSPPLGPRPGFGPATTIRYVPWRAPAPLEACLEGGVLTLPLPLLFEVPPRRYKPGADMWLAWFVAYQQQEERAREVEELREWKHEWAYAEMAADKGSEE